MKRPVSTSSAASSVLHLFRTALVLAVCSDSCGFLVELMFVVYQGPRNRGRSWLFSFSFSYHSCYSCCTRSFAFSIRVQSCTVSFSIHRVSRHETCLRHTSTALFPLGCGSLCLVLLLCMAPGRACTTAAAVHHCLRSCHDGALFPWPPPCWPWPVFVLEVPMPLQVGPVFGLGLRWQRPGCSWLHGPRPSSLP